MAYYLNRAEIIGNVVAKPEIKEFNNGGVIATFSVATNFSYTNKETGEVITTTEFHNCSVSGEFGRTCAQYLHKGSKVFVDGHLHTQMWVGKEDGAKKQKTEIKVRKLIFLDPKPQDDNDNKG